MTVNEYNNTVDELGDRLFGYVFKLTGHREDAENVVQSTYEQLWKKRNSIDTSTVKAWMYRVAHNLFIDDVRKKRPDSKEIEEMNAPRVNEEYLGLKDVVEQALSKLNEKQKAVIMLRDYEGYDYKSIGEITNMNEGQVKITLFRARKAIKEYIKDLELVL